MVATVLVLGLLVVAAATDLRWHKIYNTTTYPGILAACGLNTLGSLLVRVGIARPEALERLGWIGLGPSLVGCLACGLVLLVCYVLLRVGGGDVKLMAMVGAFLGPDRGVKAMLWTFVLGGCVGLVVLIWRVGPLRLLTAAVRHLLWTVRLRRLDPLTPDERAHLQPPLYLAPSALAAVVIVEFSLVEWLGGVIGPS
jgi:prepilin peptidase CpaA